MADRHPVPRIAATVILLATIAGNGFVAPEPCAQNRSEAQVGCDLASSCCCGIPTSTSPLRHPRGSDQSPCGCHRDDESGPKPHSLPDEIKGRTLKWASRVDGTSSSVVLVVLKPQSPFGDGISTPSPRSVQTMLCIWRI